MSVTQIIAPTPTVALDPLAKETDEQLFDLLLYTVCEVAMRANDPHAAIKREKQLKTWNRAWKIALIENDNPYWSDLWPSLRIGSF